MLLSSSITPGCITVTMVLGSLKKVHQTSAAHVLTKTKSMTTFHLCWPPYIGLPSNKIQSSKIFLLTYKTVLVGHHHKSLISLVPLGCYVPYTHHTRL